MEELIDRYKNTQGRGCLRWTYEHYTQVHGQIIYTLILFSAVMSWQMLWLSGCW